MMVYVLLEYLHSTFQDMASCVHSCKQYFIEMIDVYVVQWNSKSDITTGLSGSLPLTVFDRAMENTIVISPFREFMAASSHVDTSSDLHELQLGVFGLADQVTILYIEQALCDVCSNVRRDSYINNCSYLLNLKTYVFVT